VDWASLAKQWIAQREVMGMTPAAQLVPAAPPPPPPPPQPTDDDDSGTATDFPPSGQQLPSTDIDTAQEDPGLYVNKCIVYVLHVAQFPLVC